MKTDHNYYFNQFQEGNERGLAFFYGCFYPSLYYWGLKYVKDDVNADCIVKEAFLRLWLSRKQISNAAEIKTFVERLTRDGCKAYYRVSKHRFQRSMLRLDEIENYQDFMCAYNPHDEEDTDTLHQQEDEEELKKQWLQVSKMIPNLTQDQQMYIRLCLKYSFNYDRIAWHIGGISDYEVARKVEKTLECLTAIFRNTQKLDTVATASRFRFEGDLNDEQTAILHMRYELQYSFNDIAKALNLEQGHIQRVFAHACTKVKRVKI